ncbi:DUF460 domain-containing protein [Candidatus Bathyarchaeota archaeon]|nr:DUF460 domain-containing protein [Candidatus Bathyarchaeota archaeon]
MFELASNFDALKRLSTRLPPRTRLVQVTGSPQHTQTIGQVAEQFGICLSPNPSPIETARVAGILAFRGAGCELRFLENRTKILVCRAISLGPGGSSQTRYRRYVHSLILNLTRRIQRSLEDAGLSYELSTLKSDFGLERGDFTVYAPREELIGVVKPMKGSYVQVKIQPVFKEMIDFVSRKSSPDQNLAKSRKLIVGVDPGTTCGVAVLTFGGEPLYLDSRKGLTRAEITELLIKFGETVLVAADVSPAPQFVEKLAKSIDATLFTPEATLEVAEKQELTLAYSKQFKIEVKDTHERDALAAAIKALQQFKNKFEQAEARISELGIQVPLDEVKALIVKGYSIQRAIELLLPKQEEVKEPIAKTPSVESSREKPKLIEQLRKKISIQSRQIERLRTQNEQLTCQIKALQTSLSEVQSALEKARAEPLIAIKREREYQNLQREIENLRKQIASLNAEVLQYRQRLEALRRMKELESRGEAVLLKPVEAFTKTGLEKAFQLYEIKRDDIVLFLDASGGGASTAEILAKRGVKAIITCTAMSHQAEEKFKDYGIPILPIENIHVEWVEGYPYAKIVEIESAFRKLTEAEKADAEQKLKKLIEDYRRERLSGI